MTITNIKKENNGVKKTDIALVLFKTLSIKSFSYPFNSTAKVKEALSISVKQILGDGGDSVAVIPFFTKREKNLSNGCAFMISRDALDKAEQDLSENTYIWPAPLAFISEVNGNGLVICVGGGIQGMLFKNNTPILSLWMSNTSSVSDMEDWFKQYAITAGIVVDKVFIADLYTIDALQVEKACQKSIAMIPILDGFSLAGRSAERKAGCDDFMIKAFTTLRCAAVLGIIFALFAGVLFIQSILYRDIFASLPSTVYFKAFGEPSSSPVSTVLKKVKLIPEDGMSTTIKDVLGSMSYAYKESDKNLKVELFRYSDKSSEIQGTADSAEIAENFRANLAEKGFIAKMSDIRQIPKSGMRFSIALERKDVR